MPRIIFEENETIPENLKTSVVKNAEGKFETDASGIISKNAELLGEVKTLKTKANELTTENQRLNADNARLTSSALPEGKIAADIEIVKLGEKAKEAGLKITEIPTLKTAKETVEKEFADYKANIERTEVLAEAAEKLGLNERFLTLAKSQGVKVEKKSETKDGKEIVSFHVSSEKDGQTISTELSEFIKTDSVFAPFYDTFTQSKQTIGGGWVRQESREGRTPVDKFEAIEREVKNRQIAAAPTGSLSDQFYNRIPLKTE